MLGLHRAIPFLVLVAACGSATSSIPDPALETPTDGGAPTGDDASSPDGGGATLDGATDAPKGKPLPDAGTADAPDDAPAVDAGLCAPSPIAYTQWNLTGTQCIFVKGGRYLVTSMGEADCAHPVIGPCGSLCTGDILDGMGNVVGHSAVTYYTSDNHDPADPNFQRTPYDRAVSGSPGTCP